MSDWLVGTLHDSRLSGSELDAGGGRHNSGVDCYRDVAAKLGRLIPTAHTAAVTLGSGGGSEPMLLNRDGCFPRR